MLYFVESVDPDPEVKQPVVGCCRIFCVCFGMSLPIPKIQLSVLQKE